MSTQQVIGQLTNLELLVPNSQADVGASAEVTILDEINARDDAIEQAYSEGRISSTEYQDLQSANDEAYQTAYNSNFAEDI